MAEKTTMTEEQKAKMAEGRKKAAEKKAAEKAAKAAAEAKTPNADPRDTEIAELKAQLAELMKMQAQPQVIQVSASTEKIFFLWMAEVADDNIVEFGPNGMYGRIVGKTGSFYMPKDDLSRILDGLNRYFLDQRWLIVVSGLTDDERKAYGVDYKEGELLDQKAFAKMVELGDEILEIYPKLCEGHKAMVAKHFYEAWQKRNPHIKGHIVTALNSMSKTPENERGSFIRILEEMKADELHG